MPVRNAMPVRSGNQLASLSITWLSALLLGLACATALAQTFPPVAGISAVAAGGGHTCAINDASGLVCWGFNSNGQLGINTTVDRNSPAPVAGLESGVTRVAAGGLHSCALTAAGAVRCWGANNFGQLGDGTTTDRLTSVAVTGISSGAVAIEAGGWHSCALLDTGAVKCWGRNTEGQLGIGSTADALTPATVTGLGSATAISTGGLHSCAIAGGGVWCWGSNAHDQLGNAGPQDRLTPQVVAGLAGGEQAISLGMQHSCVLTAGGGVTCWGAYLGSTPVAVGGFSGIGSISSGGHHVCALSGGGAVSCAGYNGLGQLGDNTSIDRLSAVNVVGLGSGIGQIAAGGTHSCALTLSGEVSCWGLNDKGQLGWVDELVPELTLAETTRQDALGGGL